MILGIDATNIRSGGGLTHLKEVLENGNPIDFGFEKVIIWSNNSTLNKIPDKDWLIKKTHYLLNKSFIWSFFFQYFFFSKILKEEMCSILFVPGGTFLGRFENYVTMSRNILPFDKNEARRFKNLNTRIRLYILNLTQSYSFKRSKGLIFLTDFAKNCVLGQIRSVNNYTIIPHGINIKFQNNPKEQIAITNYTFENPFKLLYISIVNVYKHQWNVATAVIRLRDEGYPVELELIGNSNFESLNKLQKVLKNDRKNVVKYLGMIPYEELSHFYHSADAFVFASSCENMPNILLEAMSSGLPIASSNKGPMPEVLEDACFYFNPLDVESIYLSIKELLNEHDKRLLFANKSFKLSKNYNWSNTASLTFEYLSKHKND
ncbi:glycosyltransferase family 4 protein [Aquirufa sp. ROCK-SH2]